MIRPTCTIAVLIFSLSACDVPPSRADIIRNLPVTSLDAGLAEFEAVCFDGQADDPNDPFLFTNDTLSNGKTLCSMRARAPRDTNVRETLRQRYGPLQRLGIAGIVEVLTGYPGGEVLYQPGIGNSAGEGTYQLGLLND